MRCRPEEEEDAAGAGAVDFEGKEVFYTPGFNGTGPAGMGPMTGGGRGYSILPRLTMVQRRHQVLNIWVPVISPTG